MTRTMRIIADNPGLDSSREEVIRWHRQWQLTPAQSQVVLHNLAHQLLESWNDSVTRWGMKRTKQKLNKEILDLTTSLWFESISLDWMSAVNMDSMPNVATEEYKQID